MAAIELVLDTNVVLDLWVFRHPPAAPLAQAVETGRVHWIASAAMLAELRAVLARAPQPRWAEAFERALTCDFTLKVQQVDETIVAPAQRLHCTDPDDQRFIDLALARPAAALLTRDRALLRLARRARARGVIVAPPEAWLQHPAALDALRP
jgi:uncharacterized protein